MMNNTRFIFGVLLVLAAASCTMEDNFQDKQLKEQELTIEARRVDEDQTRTYRDDADGSVWWTPGDAISLFYGSGTNGGSKFTSNATENTLVTNFTGTITAITGGGEVAVEDTYFWGLYPYSEDASCDGSSVTMSLSKEQTAVPGSFATNTFPSLGRSQGLIMGFYNICGGVKISVTKEGIKKVTLKSANGELITGKAKVHFEDGIPVAEIIDGSDEVVLEAPAGEYFEVGQFYYIVIFPTTFTNGFTVKLETFTEEATVEMAKTITAKRSVFGKLANIDTGATYSQKTGNIPVEDANFKAYLVENFDGNGDGEISYEEAADIESLGIYESNIESLSGIEYMIGLTNLDCSYNQLTSIDLSNNAALTGLFCNNNQIASLDISNNTALSTIYCSYNQLTSLDVSNNSALTSLECCNNQLTSLDISNNTALTELYCDNNQIAFLDVSNNTALRTFCCTYNQLTSLDVSNNTALKSFECCKNQLTSLDVSNNTALTKFFCHYNQLTSLDLSKNTALTWLNCCCNQLTSLDVSSCTALNSLECGSTLLTSLDVSSCIALGSLSCPDSQLTSLDVSNNTALSSIYCSDNQLTAIDLSNNTALRYLYCSYNQLTSLDVSKNTALIWLNCYNNQLTSLDVSNNIGLKYLYCSPMNDLDGNNILATLYVSQGQVIPCVTEDRSDERIPAETEIVNISGGDNPIGDLPVPEIVDLGLSVKWASFNLEEEYGYFSWGEIYEKSPYAWRTYKWGDGSSEPSESPFIAPVTKYNTNTSFGLIDNKTTLEPEDDAAHMRLGGKWRMPTYDEWVELIEECDWEKTSDGYIVRSRTNENSIFLGVNSGCYGRVGEMDMWDDGIARYWSSSLDEDCPTNAWRFGARFFEDGDIEEQIYLTQDIRSAGLAIRPVYAE